MATAACAQGSALDRRVTAVADGLGELHCDARADACGDGAHWYRVSSDVWFGRSVNDGDGSMTMMQCEAGPLRVRVTLVAREVVRIENFIGPLKHDETATDLGATDAREATAWLATVARSASGRPARDAISAVTLVKGGAAADGLAAIARDEDRARDTRRASLSALLRLEDGSGMPLLITLGEAGRDTWLGAEATRVVGRSGDPRARRHLRAVLADRARPQELRAAAAAGLGNEYATGEDAKLLRDQFGSFENDETRGTVLNAIAAVGGRTNATWIIALARDETQSTNTRRRAVSAASRAGATGVDLAALYDAAPDTETRGAVITALANDGSRPSRDKLLAIAKSTETASIRRRAVSALERFDSPEVREMLTTIAMPRP